MLADPHHPPAPVVVDRAQGINGELVLRRVGGHYEIISNGTFLMDTRNGESERLLIDAALAGRTTAARVLIGGLGVGFSLAQAAGRPTREITVVELEPAVIGWHSTHLRPFSAGALDDPRVRIECADLAAWLRDAPGREDRYDAICLDTDNGPDWTVTEANTRLYDDEGLRRIRRMLTPGGVLAVWSAGASQAYEDRLSRTFPSVDVHRVTVPRGEPDVIYLARAA